VALDLREIKKTVIDSIKAAIGDDLSQTYNSVLDESYGTVLLARPNKELPTPAYPYAVLDVTAIENVGNHLTFLYYDTDLDQFVYETHKNIDMQVSIYGTGAMQLANKLEGAYRIDVIREILINGGLGLGDVQQVQILPELLQTDFLEVAFIKLSVRASDRYVDVDLTSIDDVVLTGELYDATIVDPLTITVDTTTQN